MSTNISPPIFNAECIFVEGKQWYYLTQSCGARVFHAFPSGITESERKRATGIRTHYEFQFRTLATTP